VTAVRTLIVDDDFRSASLHRSYTERLDGFMVVGEAHTGAEALDLVDATAADLVLLDIYLPDISGLEVMRRLRASDTPVDVIAVTAAKDVETLRGAMQGGVLHYLVKPFLYDTFRERLERYATLKRRLGRMREATQEDVDRLFALLRAEGRDGLPKGISSPTLRLVIEALHDVSEALPAGDIAESAGISRGTARRYLDYLATAGTVELTLRYGAAGRPEHLYRWVSSQPSRP
jgi:two-component system CitB family response regulator